MHTELLLHSLPRDVRAPPPMPLSTICSNTSMVCHVVPQACRGQPCMVSSSSILVGLSMQCMSLDAWKQCMQSCSGMSMLALLSTWIFSKHGYLANMDIKQRVLFHSVHSVVKSCLNCSCVIRHYCTSQLLVCCDQSEHVPL